MINQIKNIRLYFIFIRNDAASFRNAIINDEIIFEQCNMTLRLNGNRVTCKCNR